MIKKRLGVTLVIPVYNEESYLRDCLLAIAAQTVKPLEVIVVDNNSTDQSVAIAQSFPFVKVIHESRQGVVFARDTGFNAAAGEIIGRLDADSNLAPDWVEQVQKLFLDPKLAAVSGSIRYRDIGLASAFDTIDAHIRSYLAQRMAACNELFLYGVNMAIRRDSWNKVRNDVCHERRLHEDLDLAAHMARSGQKIIFSAPLQASISPRQAAASPREFYRYVWSNAYIYKKHKMRSLRYVRQVAFFVSCLYVPIRLMYRGYDPVQGRFSLLYALHNSTTARVSPISETL